MSIIDRIVKAENPQRPLLRNLRESPNPVIIYGAGVYSYVLKRFLAANGIAVTAMMVDAAYRSEKTFMGLPVVTLEESLDRLPDCHVVVGITNYPEFVGKLAGLGATRIHVIDIPDYLNMPHAFMDMEFVTNNRDAFEQAGGLFADDLSRETYVASINTKINEDLNFIKPYVRLDELYFPSTEFPLRKDEVLLDVGGFTGDTIRQFHHISKGQYASIISLEPCDENFGKLLETVRSLGLSNVIPLKVGAWDEKATLSFVTNELNIDNQIAASGSHSIDVDTIDSILGHTDAPAVTLIKLDINGAEYRALSGARETIRACRPRIVVRMHRKEDYFRLPMLLNELAPGIKLYLRQRNYMSMMLVLYGVYD